MQNILRVPRTALPSRRPVPVLSQNRLGGKPRPSVPSSLKASILQRLRFCIAFIDDEDDCLPDRRKKALHETSLPSQAAMSRDELDIVDAVVDEFWATEGSKRREA